MIYLTLPHKSSSREDIQRKVWRHMFNLTGVDTGAMGSAREGDMCCECDLSAIFNLYSTPWSNFTFIFPLIYENKYCASIR